MKKSRLLVATCALSVLISTIANASLVVPSGLNPGDVYHVIFVSSTSRDATSANIADYDAHVQAAADAAGIGASIGMNWLAIGSTVGGVSARTHIAPLFQNLLDAGDKIYNQNGDLVASSFNALWGTLNRRVRYDEYGNATILASPWTGTLTSGHTASNSLGTITPIYGKESQVFAWLNKGTAANTESRQLYAISSAITVAAVPVPATAWLFGSGLLGLIGIARRKIS